jgi:hypothetical protein
MVFAADYPVLDVLWTMIIFFCGVTSRAGRGRASSMTEIGGTA